MIPGMTWYFTNESATRPLLRPRPREDGSIFVRRDSIWYWIISIVPVIPPPVHSIPFIHRPCVTITTKGARLLPLHTSRPSGWSQRYHAASTSRSAFRLTNSIPDNLENDTCLTITNTVRESQNNTMNIKTCFYLALAVAPMVHATSMNLRGGSNNNNTLPLDLLEEVRSRKASLSCHKEIKSFV